MSFKDINEKYKKIFECDFSKKMEENRKALNEITKNYNKPYEFTKKEILRLMGSIDKEIGRHLDRFLKSDRSDKDYVEDLNKVVFDLKTIEKFLKSTNSQK